MKEIVVLEICPIEVIVTPKSTTARMISDFPGNENLGKVAREFFHAKKIDDLSVIPVMDRHPGNFPHRSQVVLYWEATWNKGVNAPVYPGFDPSNN